MFLIHNSTRDYIFPIDRNKLHIKAMVQDNNLKQVSIVYWNRFHKQIEKQELNIIGTSYNVDYFETEIIFETTVQYIKYYFELEDICGNKSYWGYYGQTDTIPDELSFEYLATAENDITSVPKWACGSIWYQIFPDRYFNADTDNDPKDISNWGDLPTRENFFGGDLQGIKCKLPYIKSLGVDVIYLTPIFQSPSNHKYDTVDYFTIDPAFGTKKDLIDLVDSAHSMNLKIVLDGVFNHIGFYSKQFQDVYKNGVNSKYVNWFYIKDFPVNTEIPNYECVGYYKWMPKLRYSNLEVRQFVLDIGKYWIKEANIDGWRLDVSDEVDYTFWQEFRNEIKNCNKECFLLGETWKDGNDLLHGDQMDSVMNYLFRNPVVDYFGKQQISANEFVNRISKMLFEYNKPFRPVLYNLIGSHDTERFATACNGDMRKFVSAVVFQMVFEGMPAIYYGDEIGLEGENDPLCRKTMNWDEIDNKIADFYREIINIRKTRQNLIDGRTRIKCLDDKIIELERTGEHGSSLIIFNCNNEPYEFILKNQYIANKAIMCDCGTLEFSTNEIGNESDGNGKYPRIFMDSYHILIIDTNKPEENIKNIQL